MIRRARITDVPAMGKIINDCAEYGLMLPRSLASLYENVRDYHVAVEPQGNGERVIGVGGLKIMWANLAEVYALAVASDRRGQGIGRQLVLTCVDEAEQLGIRRLMTLTYEQAFFEKMHFTVVDRQTLPLKVWSECVRCPKNQACDEIAMQRVLEDVPELIVPQPEAPPVGRVSMPVILRTTARRPAALPPVEDD